MSTTTVATEKTLIEDVDQEDELSKIRITNDINIKYLNKTGRVDFAVAVFVQNSDANAVDSPYVAWYVLRTQSSAKFVWSKSQEVGVEYEVDGAKMTAGPVTAEAGSTWDFVHEQADSTPYLRRDVTTNPNANGAVIVRNKEPFLWPGQSYDFGLYKNGKTLIIQKDVGVSSQAVFICTPVLHFGVVKTLRTGDVFKTLALTLAHTTVDLRKYINGFYITLFQNMPAGTYEFQVKEASPMDFI